MTEEIMAPEIPRLFGTDGIRDIANRGPLQADRVLALGQATAELLAKKSGRRGRVGLGWDTRLSSPMLAAALSAGLSSSGADVYTFGVMPTPAVAFLTRHYGLDAGIVISASHNPAADNGIKYFAAGGTKFPDDQEQALEAALADNRFFTHRQGVDMGQVRPVAADAAGHYTAGLHKHFRRAGFTGIKLVVDMANGATCRTAPLVLENLGARVHYLADCPDGANINAGCGSLHPEIMARKAKASGADAGLALDGDGDRVLLADEKGRVLNGDRILGILAVRYARRGGLPRRTVVATVMSNLGLELYLRGRNITLLRAAVGDRYVAQMMREQGAGLGGEQSGHILLPRFLPTGDGLLTALEVLAALRSGDVPLSELAGGWQDFPQLLVNVTVSSRPDLLSLPAVQQEVAAAERTLQNRGRVNLRYSGTEPLARVMVEAETRDLVSTWANRIADAVADAIGDGRRRNATWLTSA
jgi:phosphoglucosamine mutase